MLTLSPPPLRAGQRRREDEEENCRRQCPPFPQGRNRQQDKRADGVVLWLQLHVWEAQLITCNSSLDRLKLKAQAASTKGIQQAL